MDSKTLKILGELTAIGTKFSCELKSIKEIKT